MSDWQFLGDFSVGRNWLYLPLTNCNLFKFKLDRFSIGSKILIAQYEVINDENFIYEPKEYFCDSNLILYIPLLLTRSRGICMRLTSGKTLTATIDEQNLTGMIPTEDWQELTLINGWGLWEPPNAPFRGFIDPFGVVHLEGVIIGDSASSLVFASLPPRFRPNYFVVSLINSGNADGFISNNRMVIDPSGLCRLEYAGVWNVISCMQYRP